MKKNEEIVLKYLSGLMTGQEAGLFENELRKSDELNAEFTRLKNKLGSMTVSEEIGVNEAYFNNLMPRVHERLNQRKKYLSFSRFYYAVPTAAAIIIAFLFLFRPHSGFDMNYRDLTDEIVNNLSDSTTSDKYLADLETDPSGELSTSDGDEFNVQIPDDFDLSSSAASILMESSVPDEYSFKNLSDNDIKSISLKMNTINLR